MSSRYDQTCYCEHHRFLSTYSWSYIAKGQDTFTPISFVVDGEIRQNGSTGDMIFKIPYLISHISSIMTLLEGEVIRTGREGCTFSFFSLALEQVFLKWMNIHLKKVGYKKTITNFSIDLKLFSTSICIVALEP